MKTFLLTTSLLTALPASAAFFCTAANQPPFQFDGASQELVFNPGTRLAFGYVASKHHTLYTRGGDQIDRYGFEGDDGLKFSLSLKRAWEGPQPEPRPCPRCGNKEAWVTATLRKDGQTTGYLCQ